MAKIQSVEPNIADLANGWLKSYKLDYKLEQESLHKVKKALSQASLLKKRMASRNPQTSQSPAISKVKLEENY